MADLVSPFDDRRREPTPLAPRLETVAGKRVTLLSIGKPKSAEFLEELGQVLHEQYGATVTHATKPTFTRPAPLDLAEQVVDGSEAIIEALAD